MLMSGKSKMMFCNIFADILCYKNNRYFALIKNNLIQLITKNLIT